ncbi:MAG: hypothetical protein ACKOEO_13620 [Planctomycetaceae bacterium]
MVAENTPQNPYASPAFQEPAGEVVVWHRNYQLIGPKVLCHNGLLLPDYCLVTGASDEIVHVPISIWAATHSSRLCRRLSIACLLCAPLSITAALLLIGPGFPPSNPFAVTLILTTPLLLIAGLILFLRGGRRRKLCQLQGLLHQKRLVWQRRLTIIPVCSMLVLFCLRLAGVIGRDWAFAAVVGPFILTWLLGNFVFLRGLRLRAIQVDGDLFELRGFSGAFLKRLQEQTHGN